MDIKKIKVGDVLSETQFYKVSKVIEGGLELVTDGGQSIKLGDKYVEQLLVSGNLYDSTEKITRTDLAEKVISSSRIAMSVNYNKQVKDVDVTKGITNIYEELGMGMSKIDFGKKVKKALSLKGEERTMIGRHYGSVDNNGRLSFIDMNEVNNPDKDYDTRLRLVDPRTLNWAIIEGVKYQVK